MKILNTKIDLITRKKLVSTLASFIEDGQKHHIVTTNPEFILEACVNVSFHNVINTSALSLPDGIGVVVALDYLQKSLSTARIFHRYVAYIHSVIAVLFLHKEVVIDGVTVERIPGVDLIWLLMQQDWMKGRKVYLLGGRDSVADLAAQRLHELNPAIHFKSSPGHTDIRAVSDTRSAENQALIADINSFAPDILLVAYGHPWQDLWIDQYTQRLSYRIAVGVGGSFDYISHKIKRAPLWMQNLGLEWLYRLVTHPRRYRRIFNATWRFSQLVIHTV
jgi:N-acetylglucosaminyldiphosphoundecaprenol N-acetyl-beta-D-mannosaminyltransferase